MNQYLMLANVYKPEKHKVAGAFVSEKLDGTRAYWDGGVSRGVPTTNVPWANVLDPKNPGGLKKKILPVATGLWSRYGNPIMAPDWFLNQLPACPLDGELWVDRGEFQACRSIVGRDTPDDRWRDVHFVVFGSPSPANVYIQREIKGANIKLTISADEIFKFVNQRVDDGVVEDYNALPGQATFEEELQFLSTAVQDNGNIFMHRQRQLSSHEGQAKEELRRFMDEVLEAGGEGVMIRLAASVWVPKRSHALLKVKPFKDDTAIVTGFTSGRETDKGSKHRGKIGALITNYQGQRLELSGMTDNERMFLTRDMEQHAYENPGVDMPDNFQGIHIKTGDTVEFRYVDHKTDAGLPKEARFMRVV